MTADGETSPFKILPNASYSWCETDRKLVKFCHIWTIKKFSYLTETNGECIRSSSFKATEDDKNKWYLTLYPSGEEEDDEDYVSLFLNHQPDDQDCKVNVAYECAILNNKREKSNIEKVSSHNFKKRYRSFGFSNFINREDLTCVGSEFLRDDELTILCEAVIISKPENNTDSRNPIYVRETKCHVLEDLERLENQHLSDVVLVVGKRELRAHKTILTARSSVFKAMFEHDMEENRENRVNISDINYNIFEQTIRFIYTGKTPALDEKMATEILAAADKYALDDLKFICEQSLSICLTSENVVNLFRLASLHNASHLKAQIVKFMESCGKNDVVNHLWNNVISQQPELVAAAFENCKN